LAAWLAAQLHRAGDSDARFFELAATKLAYCQGEFDCWVKTPGICPCSQCRRGDPAAIHEGDNLGARRGDLRRSQLHSETPSSQTSERRWLVPVNAN
jgi:hypothetical protein